MIEGKSPDASLWLHLSGEWQRGNLEVVYGQVVRYDTLRDRLQPLLSWTSSAGQLPRWQQVTGSTTAELVVDQTVGLEPQFQVYQVRASHTPGKSAQLEAIALSQAGLEQPAYTQALFLARSGLWSPALNLLQSLKQTQAQWSTTAQAQMDLIALHARVTQAQTSRDWASPTQQITALLIDGRWAKALDLLRSAHGNGYDVKSLLSANGKSWRQRVEAFLQVHPHQLEAQQWGALTVAVQRDRSAATAWLKQHHLAADGRSLRARQQILNLLDPPSSPTPSHLTAAPAAPAPVSTPFTIPRLIGSVTPLSTLRPDDWFSPMPLNLSAQQTWYQIQVLGIQEGQQWQRSPFAGMTSSNLKDTEALWNRLGLASMPPLQIRVESDASPQLISSSIRAMQWQAGELQLLAAADSRPQFYPRQSAIAITPDTLGWLAPLDVLTLASLSQQQPQQTATLIKALERELQQAGQALPKSASASSEASTPADRLSQVGDWLVDRMELTGDTQAEIVITLTTEVFNASSNTSPTSNTSPASLTHTVIFSSTGSVLYSDLAMADQAIVAIADLQNGTLPALVIRTGQTYKIQQWSQQQQRFE